MASSEILSQTLYSITSIKLEQLERQRGAYESAKRSLLDDATYETDSRKRAKILVDGAEKLPSMTSLTESPLLSLENFKRFVQQAEHDPSVSESFLMDCEGTMRNELDVQSARYRFADLYGKLVTEWISSGKSEDSDSDSGFVPVGREEMHAQRKTWEELVFRPKLTDVDGIKTYLDGLFQESSKDVERAFKDLKDGLKTFQKGWDGQVHFNESVLTSSIRGLLRTDILTDQKRKTLQDFLNNKVVLQEIADVLNMRMQTLDSWEWEGVNTIDQRRQLNGRYRFYPDEDLLQMLFLHYIGLRWAVEIRGLFKQLLTSGVFKPTTKPMNKKDTRRRRFFLNTKGALESHVSLESKLDRHFQEEILLDHLPVDMAEVRGSYGDDGNPGAEDSRRSHTAVVQDLLQLLQSQIIVDTKLGKEVTVIRSDFKWFGPSIPHSSIFAVLEYLGVKSEWVNFFRKTLEAPIRFSQDAPDTPVQTRVRGTPLSMPLADFFAESMLFCLDFAVNQKADGARLYRLHDDMWLWGSVETCQLGWKAMTEFADLMGLEFSPEKTGSVKIMRNGTSSGKMPSRLPKGDVVWGFLKLDAVTGRFLIDQSKVDQHIDELRLQLEACKSVFDWIQAWNIYGCRFFATNFGKLANCYSREHVDSMLATFARIQEKLFGKTGGVSAHVKRMIAERCGVDDMDIPDGWLSFPISLGGLGLMNPFINLYLLRKSVVKNPDKILDDFLEEEEARYRRLKAAYDGTEDVRGWNMSRHEIETDFKDLKGEPFFSLEEYTRYRERTSDTLAAAMERLQTERTSKLLERRGDVEVAAQHVDRWHALSDYERWVCTLYAKDMLSRFGGMNVVDKGLLPMGLMDMLRQSRFKWQG